MSFFIRTYRTGAPDFHKAASEEKEAAKNEAATLATEIEAKPRNKKPKRSRGKRRPSKIPPLVQEVLKNPQKRLSAEERINILSTCMLMGKEQAEDAKDEDVVMVIGNTGAGKSTLVNFLHGCQMEQIRLKVPAVEDGVVKAAGSKHAAKKKRGKRKAKGEKVVQVKLDSDPPELMRIGHSNVSETFVPEVQVDDEPGFTYCDCPGFLDTRGAVINVGSRYSKLAVLFSLCLIR